MPKSNFNKVIKLLSNFTEIPLRHGSSPVHLLHIFRTPFSRNTSGWLLLKSVQKSVAWLNSQLNVLVNMQTKKNTFLKTMTSRRSIKLPNLINSGFGKNFNESRQWNISTDAPSLPHNFLAQFSYNG